MFSRAINGVSRPVFYKGEQIGERRHYDERLAMFILRYRDPVRYGAWRDKCIAERHPEGAAISLEQALLNTAFDARQREAGLPPLPRKPLKTTRIVADAAEVDVEAPEAAADSEDRFDWEALLEALAAEEDRSADDVPRT